jgi:hypothetical protein
MISPGNRGVVILLAEIMSPLSHIVTVSNHRILELERGRG